MLAVTTVVVSEREQRGCHKIAKFTHNCCALPCVRHHHSQPVHAHSRKFERAVVGEGVHTFLGWRGERAWLTSAAAVSFLICVGRGTQKKKSTGKNRQAGSRAIFKVRTCTRHALRKRSFTNACNIQHIPMLDSTWRKRPFKCGLVSLIEADTPGAKITQFATKTN